MFVQHNQRWVSRDYLPIGLSEDVNVLEAKDLLTAPVAFRGRLSNSRVGIRIDRNRGIKCAVGGDGCRNSTVKDVVKDLFR